MSLRAALGLAMWLACSLRADISGTVRDAVSLAPIAGAFVHLRSDGGTSGVNTGVDGRFTLTINPAVPSEIAASIAYDRAAPINYLIGGTVASNGESNALINLERLPANDDPNYTPASSVSCSGCHPTIYSQWNNSNHAHTARNSWVMDLYSGNGTPGGGAGYVYRSSHPGSTGFCATCHTPMAEVRNPGTVYLDEVSEPGALEGVNCVSCHQLDALNVAHLNALHLVGGKATYRFPLGSVPAGDYVWGPLTDSTFSGMKSSHSPLQRDSLLCASCHQYNHPGNGVQGQHTYTEWQASSYAIPGPGYRTCQDCHMPAATGLGSVCVQGPHNRSGAERRDHNMIGSTPQMLQANISLTAIASEIGPGRIRASADVRNVGAGHSFPTGIAIRNALLILTARYNGVDLAQVAGPTIPFWGSDDVPGNQPGDYAGYPGKGFAKVLEGRINGQGPVVRAVMFIDAEGVFSSTAILSGATDNTVVEFELPPGVPAGAIISVEARLLYRRVFRSYQVSKGWTTSAHGGPIEIEVANRQLQVVTQGSMFAIPTMQRGVLAALALALAGLGVALLARGQ
jgi:cytochrome c554/c'-like protein